MKVGGFTFIRNAVIYDFPIVESILSILPLVDEYVVLVGKSEDKTLELIQSIQSSKIKIFSSIWDDSLKKGGQVLARETDKAFKLLSEDIDWAFYLQGDEVIHEKYLPTIHQAMFDYLSVKPVDGLLLKYKHFYGSYDFIGDSRRWYRREIRVIRRGREISSYRDAQGFRMKNKKLNVKSIDAWVYHYGWVKPPELQKAKLNYFPSLYTDEKKVKKSSFDIDSFDYSQIDSLAIFDGEHPKVMEARIDAKNWNFDFDPTQKNFSFKTKISNWIERYTNYRIGEYKNYILLK